MFRCCWYSLVQVRCVRSAINIYRRTEPEVCVLCYGLKQVFVLKQRNHRLSFISFCKCVIWAVVRPSTHAVNERRVHLVGTHASKLGGPVFKPRLYSQVLRGYGRVTNVLHGDSEVAGARRKCDVKTQQETYPGVSTEYK